MARVLIVAIFLGLILFSGRAEARKDCPFPELGKFDKLLRLRNIKTTEKMEPELAKLVWGFQKISDMGVPANDPRRDPLMISFAREAMFDAYKSYIEYTDLTRKQKDELQQARQVALNRLRAESGETDLGEELDREKDMDRDERPPHRLRTTDTWENLGDEYEKQFPPERETPEAEAERDQLSKRLEKYLKRDATIRCGLGGLNLFTVSEGITAMTLVTKNWISKHPRSDEEGAWNRFIHGVQQWTGEVVSPNTYTHAMTEDPMFRIQILRNTAIMALIATIRCVPRRYYVPSGTSLLSKAGRVATAKTNIVGIMSFFASLASQWATAQYELDEEKKKNWWSLRRTILDVAFTYGISYPKAVGVTYFTDLLYESEMRGAFLLAVSSQAISESTGALLYKWADELLKYVHYFPPEKIPELNAVAHQ